MVKLSPSSHCLDFDANAPMRNGQESHFNRMTLGVYELGSIFKVFTAAMALDSGMVAAHETFDWREPLQIGHYEINGCTAKSALKH